MFGTGLQGVPVIVRLCKSSPRLILLVAWPSEARCERMSPALSWQKVQSIREGRVSMQNRNVGRMSSRMYGNGWQTFNTQTSVQAYWDTLHS